MADLLEAGIIRPSQSSYCALVVMVPTPHRPWSMCADYRYLKKITIKDKILIPFIDELLDKLHGAFCWRHLPPYTLILVNLP